MRVVLATDGSESAEASARWLRTFPLPPATEFLIVSVASAPPQLLDVEPRTLRDAAAADARAAAARAQDLLAARRARITTRVLEGDAREVIARTASEWGADLVVVGARGLGAFARLLVGSVSTSVVHHAPCPVLVVRGRTRDVKHIVVAVDGSPHSLAAARFVAGLPLDHRSRVTLVGVVEQPYVPRTAPRSALKLVRAAIAEIQAGRRSELEKTIDGLASEFEARAASVERTATVGLPADTILETSRRADLVVVGARGLGGFERLLLGSVSERVLHHAPCSVLVVRQPTD